MKNSRTLQAEFARLAALEKPEPHHLQHLSPEEQEQFKQMLRLRLTRALGPKYQTEMARYKAILEPETQTEAPTEEETQTETLPDPIPQTQQFEHLLALDKIERHHVNQLPAEKKKEFMALLNNKLDTATGTERDAFVEKISAFVEQDRLWEVNHAKITQAIQEHVNMYGAMPSKSRVTKETGLSRPTVHKHMETMKASPLMNEQNELFALMSHQVLGKILQSALRGDMGAAKLYLNTVSKQNTGAASDVVINNQNNIQINNTVLNQQTIQQLKPEQLQQIEDIIKSSMAEKKQ